MADVPAKFLTRSPKGLGRAPDRHYKTMTREELIALPVIDLAAKDCFLFFWTSGTQLKNAIAVIEAWEFTYSSTAFVWVKTNPRNSRLFYDARSFHKGLGYTTRKNVELCLLGTRGRPKRQSKNVEELIIAPRREHSRKPDEIYERIETFAKGPYAELFSRTDRQGWHSAGDERGKFGEAA